MDFDREDIIEILRGMCVELPADTKLPLSALNQRLNRAISHSQASMKSKEINPDTLKRWHDVSDSRLTDVMGALSAGEVEMMMTKSAGQVISTALLNAFMLLRCIIGGIGEQGDELSKLVIINDEAGTYSFTIRVRSSFSSSPYDFNINL